MSNHILISIAAIFACTTCAQGQLVPTPADSPHHSDHQHPGPPSEPGKYFLPAPQIPPPPPGREALWNEDPATQERIGLTLDELLGLASQYNPTLRQAREQVNGTLGKALEAGLYPNPVVSYVAEQIFVQSDRSPNTPGEFQGATIQQEFVTAGKLKLSREKYLQRAKSAEWNAVAQQWKVCNDIRIHFWQTIGQQEIVDIRRELLKSAEDRALTLQERYNLGEATRADVRMTNVSLQRARLSLLSAENQFRSRLLVLTSLAGIEIAPHSLTGNLDEGTDCQLDFDSTLSRIYFESPEILAARAKWQSDYVTVQRERVQPIPNVVVQAGSGYNFETNQPVATAQVSISVPIFDRNQGTVQQAEADLARQSAEIRRLELRLRQDLADEFQVYLTALQNAFEYQSVILPEAKQAYAEQLEAYQQNRQDWGQVLHSQREYFELREQYVEHLMTWRSKEALINGYLLQGALDPAPAPTPPGHIDSVPKPR